MSATLLRQALSAQSSPANQAPLGSSFREQLKQKAQFVHPSWQLMKECEAWFRPFLDAAPTGFLAGGCMRDYFSNTPNTSDIDVFFPDPEALEESVRVIERAEGVKQLYDRENIVGYELNHQHVQFVKGKYFETPEDAIASFDFTVCCAAINHWGRVVVHPQFFEDLAAKKLNLVRLDCLVGTLGRLPRYMKKGFYPGNDTLLAIAKAMKDVDFSDPEQNSLEFYRTGKRRFGRFDKGVVVV